jgi:hypothetical protein
MNSVAEVNLLKIVGMSKSLQTIQNKKFTMGKKDKNNSGLL